MTQLQQFNTRIANLNELQKKVDEESSAMKADFQRLITDKTIPLVERWDFWISAPSSLKEDHDWLPQYGTLQNRYAKFYCDAPEVYGRGRQVEWSEILDFVFAEDGTVDACSNYKGVVVFTQEEMTELLESILSDNVATFKFDW